MLMVRGAFLGLYAVNHHTLLTDTLLTEKLQWELRDIKALVAGVVEIVPILDHQDILTLFHNKSRKSHATNLRIRKGRRDVCY